MTKTPIIYVDSDACPVKQEVLKVAARHGLKVVMIGNAWHRLGDHALLEQIVVAEGLDAADDRIAEAIETGDLAITADVPLAARCVKQGAVVLAPNGKLSTAETMGLQLATRDLMTGLREAGEITSRAPSFTKQDRSRFLSALETAVQKTKRGR